MCKGGHAAPSDIPDAESLPLLLMIMKLVIAMVVCCLCQLYTYDNSQCASGQ
jgi:hypothetical protein